MKSSRAEAMSARAGSRRGKTLSTVDSPPRTRSSPARSPARTRRASPPPVAPATRTRSPGRRSPARKSPARKSATKFPARKSPARTTEVRKSPSRKTAKIDEPVQLKPKPSEPVLRLARTRRSEYSIKDLSGLAQVEVSMGDRVNGLDIARDRIPRATVAPQKIEVVRRTSARLRDSASVQGDSVSRLSESASRSIDLPLDEDSDEEPVREKSTSSVRKLVTPVRSFTASGNHWEFGGNFGSWFLIVALPAFVFTVLAQCVTSFKFALPQLEHASVAALLSTRALLLAISQVALQTVIASLKIAGRSVERMDESGQHQYFNGFFASIITLSGIFALNFLQILSIKSILQEYVRLAVIFYILATLLAAGLFLKSRRLHDDKRNPYGNTGYTLYDFWMGRELFPQLGRVDVKIILHRICNVNGLIVSLLIFAQGVTLPEIETIDVQNYKDALGQLHYNPTLLVVSAMQLIYFLNLILNEHKITSTFSWQCEGVGYMQAVSSALYPFYFVVISKFVLDKKISLPNNILIAASVVYFVGFLIYLFSNNVKHEFRKNPLLKRLSALEAMPTLLGKKLLVSGLWGTVRHPNYLGDIILHVALAVPGACTGPSLAILPPVTTALILLHRASRDSSRCRRRYGAAWQRYCMRVRSAIIPKIY